MYVSQAVNDNNWHIISKAILCRTAVFKRLTIYQLNDRIKQAIQPSGGNGTLFQNQTVDRGGKKLL